MACGNLAGGDEEQSRIDGVEMERKVSKDISR